MPTSLNFSGVRPILECIKFHTSEPSVEIGKLLINSKTETVKLSVIEWEMWVWWKDSRNSYELYKLIIELGPI